MSNTDSPLRNQSEDKLGRAGMAKHIARLVNDYGGSESFVVGLEGEWGSGKSTFVNFIVEEIDPKKAEAIFFNPWNFSSQDKLVEDFFSTLIEKISLISSDKKLLTTLISYKRKFAKFEYEIKPSFATFSFGSAKLNLSSINTLRASLESDLQKLNKKIFIVIDDIDRLDTLETLAVFKLVKMTANFPNCIFLLSYDRKKVIERVDVATNNSGDDYLKKIIQTTFRLPEVSEKQIQGMLFDELDLILDGIYGNFQFSIEDKARWSEVVYSGFPKLFSNIRDLKRYSNSLKLNYSIIGKHEVNPLDFIVLEAIRVFTPDFFEAIHNNKWIFTGGSHIYYIADRDAERKKEAYTKIVNKCFKNKKDESTVLGFIKKIFPKLAFNSGFGANIEESWRGEKRASSSKKFDTYFQLSVPSTEMSEQEFESMIEEVNSMELPAAIEYFGKFESKEKFSDFIQKTHDRFDSYQAIYPTFFNNVSIGLFLLISGLDSLKDTFSEVLSIETQLQRLCFRILQTKDTSEDKYKFIKLLFSYGFSPAKKVYLLRYLKREKAGSAEGLATLKEALEMVILKLKPELLEMINNDSLKTIDNGTHLIWGLREWGEIEEITKYLNKLAKDKDDVFVVLEWFKTDVSSSSKGSYNQINKESFKDTVDVEIIDRTIKSINPKNLSLKNADLYEIYVNPVEQW